MIVLGVDPGARSTGLAVVDSARRLVLLAHTITRDDSGPMLPVPEDYLDEVVAWVDGHVRECFCEIHPEGDLPAAVAVEGVGRPSWHMGGKVKPIDPSAIIAAGVVMGAVYATAALYGDLEVVIVPPGANGSKPLAAYPADLVSPAERRGRGWETRVGGGLLRHVRSAYDVAVQAPLFVKRSQAWRDREHGPSGSNDAPPVGPGAPSASPAPPRVPPARAGR